MEYYTAIKEGNPTICDNVHRPRGHYAKWNKSDKDLNSVCSHLCIKSKKAELIEEVGCCWGLAVGEDEIFIQR